MNPAYRKTAALLLCTLLVLSGTACGQAASPFESMKREGVAPYELTESETSLLGAFGISSMNAQVLAVRAPKEAAGLQIHVYRLGENKTWEETEGGGIYMSTDTDGQLSGLFTMQLRENYVLDFRFSSSGSSASYQTAPISLPEESMASTHTFLQDFQEIELNQEIPIAIMSYTSGSVLNSSQLEDFFDPSGFQDLDLVQAVTLEFTD